MQLLKTSPWLQGQQQHVLFGIQEIVNSNRFEAPMS